LGSAEPRLLEGVEGRELADDPLPEETVWLAAGAPIEGESREGNVYVDSPVRGVFRDIELERTCERVAVEDVARPLPERVVPAAELGSLPAGEVDLLDGIRAAIARVVPDTELELVGVRSLVRGEMLVAMFGDPEADDPEVVALAATENGWGVVDRHQHTSMSSADGVGDLDGDGVGDFYYATEGDEGVFVSVAWSRTRRMSRFVIPNAEDRVTGCFAVVGGGPAFVETLVRGSTAGFRVHRLEGNHMEVRSGLLGRVLAAVSYQRADALVPRPRDEIWDGGDSLVTDGYFRLCPLDGRAIDVPRDAHHPVEEDPVANEPAILRVHQLASSYEELSAGPGPIVEMHTAS